MTATSITLGTTTPLTGPAAPGYSEIAPAVNAVFKMVNAKGGINGRKIKYIIENDQYDPALTATLTRKLVLQDNIFADVGPLGTPTTLAAAPFLNTEGVPSLFVESGCACWSSPSLPQTFGWQPNYIIEGKILGHYIATSLAGAKVGYLYQNDEFGQDGVKGLDQEVPASAVVSRQSYSVTTLSAGLANQVAALKAAGATVVALYTIPAATALAMLAAAEIGYHPQWVVTSVGSDVPTLSGLLSSFSKGKAGAALLNGMVSNTYLPTFTSSSPWIQVIKQILATYDGGAQLNGNTEYGVSLGITTVELLGATGKDLTRARLVSTLETVGSSLPTPGLVPLSYSKTDHYGYQGSQLERVINGVAQPFGSIYTTTNTGPLTVYTGTPTVPPAGL
ncbi:MAG: ABC transporter substrate-binding protein [Mycobacteriales bacterium]